VRDIPIRAGEIFLLPASAALAAAPAGGIGLVVERKRLPHEMDGVIWHCERCNHKLHEEYFFRCRTSKPTCPRSSRATTPAWSCTCSQCGHVDPLPAPAAG
jgi:3-hydroxyanthranilate 3,4-dioxygenase